MAERGGIKVNVNVWIVIGFALLAVVAVVQLASQGGNQPITQEGHDSLTSLSSNPLQSSPPEESGSALVSPDLSKIDPFAQLHPPVLNSFAPDFTVQTAAGKTLKLSSYQGKQNVALVFYQGHFCPVCGKQLEDFQANLEGLHGLDTELVAVSADTMNLAKQTQGERGLSFPIIADPKHTIIEKYGVANRVKQGIAWPSVVVINKQGRVAFVYAAKDGNRLHFEHLKPELEKLQ